MISRRNLILASSLGALQFPNWAHATFQANKEYLVLNPSVPQKGDKIEVIKFFAYTCPHCMQFEALFNEWAQKVPADVVVRTCPVAWQPKLRPFTQTYYTLEALQLLDKLHIPFFESVVYQTHHYDFESATKDILNFMVEQGVNAKDWERTFRSFTVQNKTRQARKLWQQYRIDSTPMIGIAGQYTTGPHLAGTRVKTLQCVDELIQLVRH